MRILLTLVVVLLLPAAAFGQSQNPLLGGAAAPAAAEDELDYFPFLGHHFAMNLPAGGEMDLPGWLDPDYAEPEIGIWDHPQCLVYRALVMVHDFDSPITADEFKMLAEEGRSAFQQDAMESRDLTPVRFVDGFNDPWYAFSLTWEEDDGYVTRVHNWMTYRRNRMFTLIFFNDDETTAALLGDVSSRNADSAVAEVIDGIIGGIEVDQPLPYEYLEFAPVTVPDYGVSVLLPTEGGMIPPGSPDLEEYSLGTVQCLFLKLMPSQAAHRVLWKVIEREQPVPADEWELYLEEFYLGYTDSPEMGPDTIQTVEWGGRTWNWFNAGVTDPEFPAESDLLFLSQTDGAIQLVMAFANTGYEEAAVGQIARLLDTAEFGEFTAPDRENETFAIKDYGMAITLPGGGMPLYPGDDDWPFGSVEMMKFHWNRSGSPVSNCTIAVQDFGETLSEEEFKDVRAGILKAAAREGHDVAAIELDPFVKGDRIWHLFDMDVAIEDKQADALCYVLSEFGMLYIIYFYYDPDRRDVAEETALKAMESVVIE